MKRLLALLILTLPMISLAGEYQSTLLVQTGQMRESDLIIRNISDLNSKKTCLVFYIRTAGTSPVLHCYDATSGFGASISQVGHFKAKDLVVRKIEDFKNKRICLVAYVSTQGTSPSVACYPREQRMKDNIIQRGHLREGDLDVHRLVDGSNTCLVAYVGTTGTSPTVVCYPTKIGGKGGLHQVSHLHEGDLIVRKIVDETNGKACLISYISTKGTTTHVICYDE